MKTQIIQLESHDDLISIRDRMAWAKSPRILLVWPRKGDVQLRPLDLKLLQRHALTLGAQVGLVTRKVRIRDEAEAFGIPVFISIPEAQRGIWQDKPLTLLRRRQTGRPDPVALRALMKEFHRFDQFNPIVRLAIFAAGVLAVLAVVAMFIPSAEITLKPVTKLQQAVIPINASPEVDAVYVSGSLPARILMLPVEIGGEIPATGEMLTPEGKASGTVSFRNQTSTLVNIPAGTVVRTLDLPVLRFVTVEAGELSPEVGSSLDLRVDALQPGAASNLDGGVALVLEGVLGLSAEAATSAPLRGGSDRRVIAPSAADYAGLRNQLLAELNEQARQDFQAALAEGDILLEETLQAGEVVEEIFEPQEGAPSSVLRLRLVVEYSGTYLRGDDLTRLVTTALDAALPEGYEPVPDTLDFAGLDEPALGNEGLLRWQVEANRLSRPKIDLSVVRRLVQGRSTEIASQYLQSYFSLVHAPRIQLSPSWWPWLPLNPFRIGINY